MQCAYISRRYEGPETHSLQGFSSNFHVFHVFHCSPLRVPITKYTRLRSSLDTVRGSNTFRPPRFLIEISVGGEMSAYLAGTMMTGKGTFELRAYRRAPC
jgi:hypothetical protein